MLGQWRTMAWADRFALVSFGLVMVAGALVVIFAPGPQP